MRRYALALVTAGSILVQAAALPAAFVALLWAMGVDLDFTPPDPPSPEQASHATNSPVIVEARP